jgi:dipeptidyl aminopeptidase/acylaminoacyl peptidase
VLYKPENFDRAKKYPVIFHYYEVRSHQRYLFKKPEPSGGAIDILWYVSNGYLVFVPDMQYRTGHTIEDIAGTAISAVKKLSEFSYVDTSRMGLQGHSFGGYETNAIICSTGIFKAAQESAGITDPVSWYGHIGFGGRSHALQYEYGQSNFGTTPWQSPDIFIKNSPLHNSQKISTPLLIMHNLKDDAVSFWQGVELFIALRRQRKAVWLLQYDEEGHIIDNPQNIEDFTKRQQQFFGHYLKDEPMPVWMSEGIPAWQKGKKSGF